MSRPRVAVLAINRTASFAASVGVAQADDYIVVLKDGVNEPTVAVDHINKGAAGVY